MGGVRIGFIGSESNWSDRNRRNDGRVLGNTIPTIPTVILTDLTQVSSIPTIPTIILIVTQVSSIPTVPTIPTNRLVDADP